MPNDDQDAQRKHGDKIRFERELMRVTGVSRSQVRASLNEFSQRVSPSPAERLSASVLRTTPPEIKVESAHLEVQPISGGPAPVPQPEPQPALGDTVEFTFVNNGGVLETWAFTNATHVAFP